MKNATVNIEDIRQFLYREARLLDEKKWEEFKKDVKKAMR